MRYGHVWQGRSGVLDAFFLLYAEAARREPKPFLDWVRDDYDGAALRRALARGPGRPSSWTACCVGSEETRVSFISPVLIRNRFSGQNHASGQRIGIRPTCLA